MSHGYDENKEQQFCDAQRALALNWQWPIGTAVRVERDNGDVFETKTRSDPWMIGGIAVIAVEGISGGYRLDRVSTAFDEIPIERLREIWSAVAQGEGRHGGFLVSFAEVFLRADPLNQAILKDAAVQLVEKYKLQDYRASVAPTYIEIEKAPE